jgi:hypothetical protein
LGRQIVTVIAVFGVGAWVAWLIFVSVRQYMVARVQNAAQEKLLARISSPESLGVFLASEAGKHFLIGLEKDPYEAWFGIIRNVQTAVVFGVLGSALVVGHFLYRETPGLLGFGLGGLTLATAFALSGVVSFVMHRHAGLVPRRRD